MKILSNFLKIFKYKPKNIIHIKYMIPESSSGFSLIQCFGLDLNFKCRNCRHKATIDKIEKFNHDKTYFKCIECGTFYKTDSLKNTTSIKNNRIIIFDVSFEDKLVEISKSDVYNIMLADGSKYIMEI